MRILIACDKFKGSLTAPEACSSVEEGILSVKPQISCEILPVADGGDGIGQTLTSAQNGIWKTLTVEDALGSPIAAGYGIFDEGRSAVIEMAEASGLAKLDPDDLSPDKANTYGTGELIRDAISEGVERIILGLGGSATNDGGTGMARALGWTFLNESEEELETLPRDLRRLARVIPPADRSLPEVTVACDVANPLLGPNGCTRIYGPQKGISPADFETHENGLSRLVQCLDAEAEAAIHGAGAAGGLGFGSLVFLGASLTPGFELVADILDLETAISRADLVITGEGKLDRQSLEGKAPYGVARLASSLGKPILSFCGIFGDEGLEDIFGEIREIRDDSLGDLENMERGRLHLVAAAADWAGSQMV
ncbi:MAG: glycerate kinase [Verrucomicrobiota bacterium]